jgi:hypothetical protein
MYNIIYSTHPPACEKNGWEDVGQGEHQRVRDLVKGIKQFKLVLGDSSRYNPTICEYSFPEFILKVADNSKCEDYGDFSDIWNHSIVAKNKAEALKIGNNLLTILNDFS